MQLRLIGLIVAFCACVVAQDINATLSGTVMDSSGAVVPNAQVSIVNEATGVVAFSGKSNDSGVYSAPSLPVGTYQIAVEAAGFSKAEIQHVTLQVDQRARVDVTLKPGELAETITVVGESIAQLEAESSSVGSVINTSQVRDLPLPSRNVLNLLPWWVAYPAAARPPGLTRVSSR